MLIKKGTACHLTLEDTIAKIFSLITFKFIYALLLSIPCLSQDLLTLYVKKNSDKIYSTCIIFII